MSIGYRHINQISLPFNRFIKVSESDGGAPVGGSGDGMRFCRKAFRVKRRTSDCVLRLCSYYELWIAFNSIKSLLRSIFSLQSEFIIFE